MFSRLAAYFSSGHRTGRASSASLGERHSGVLGAHVCSICSIALYPHAFLTQRWCVNCSYPNVRICP